MDTHKENSSYKEYAYFDRLHSEKYRDDGQSRDNHVATLAKNLATDADHQVNLLKILGDNYFIPAGRIQAALGASQRVVSPFNCSVSQKIEDNIPSIYDAISKAAMILRLGTGIGYNFSHIRPKGFLVKSLMSFASGPISYMDVFDKSAKCISSAGHRRGAQMGILNVSHPDIEEFIDAKMEKEALRYFNISVGVTDDFMQCVKNDLPWSLMFDGTITKTISAKALWDKILRNAYNSAEPGIVFLDRMNQMNNLYYCEELEATNPCAEQPLPHNGLCLLGSFNLVCYIVYDPMTDIMSFDTELFKEHIRAIVEAYDNIFDNAVYAIPEHKTEALNKRRIGLGLTGIANAIELMQGKACYGEDSFIKDLNWISKVLMITAYEASADLAEKRGPFTLFDPIKYLSGEFVKQLPDYVKDKIERHGIRNSHLISYAPCGTISQTAGNISSGVEPVFYHEVNRDVYLSSGKENISLRDYNYREHNFKGKTLEECSVNDHLAVAAICQKYCDSAVSKTVNVAQSCTYEEYSEIYMRAYDMGLKGITVFRPTELRGAVISKKEDDSSKTKTEPTEPVNTSEMFTFSCASGACER